MMQVNTNIGTSERVLSVLGGAWLLFDAIIKRKTNILQTMAGSYLLMRGVTGVCLAYQGLGKTSVEYKPQNINIKTTLTVNRPRDQVYAFWRRLEQLPQFMRHLKRVEVLDEKTSEWTANIPEIPGNLVTVSWKSEIVKDDPGALLSWHSLPESTIENAGKVTFSDAGESGTELNVVITYHAPLGLLGEKAGRLLNPMFEKMVKEDIGNFKQLIETGEIPTAEGQSSEERSRLPYSS
jgi:uncharacterized membrane protein